MDIKTPKGIAVFYISIGHLPVDQEDEYLDKIKTKFANEINSINSAGYHTMFLGQRKDCTKVEFIKF